jgi:hypothetical protein
MADIPAGATPVNIPGANAQWAGAQDLRAKLRVPDRYIQSGTPSAGPNDVIKNNGGILFPYTPSIAMDNKADYAVQVPMHSNFPINFFKNGNVGSITVTAKFTAQSPGEAAVLLGTIHLLRSLTKMRWGNEDGAGSPPPVCRFDAYGDYMFSNVPVVVANWRHELPEGVDYISVGGPASPGTSVPNTYGYSMVPTMSSITLTLNITYSRREMQNYTVSDWLQGTTVKAGGGYL